MEVEKFEATDFVQIENDEHRDIEERRVASGKNSAEKPVEQNPADEYLAEDERLIVENVDSSVKNLQQGQGPLDKEVIERGYTARTYAGDTMSPIAEPQEHRQVIIDQGPKINIPNKSDVKSSVAQSIYTDKTFATEALGEKEHPKTGGNPAVQTMTKKEREQNLEMTVDMVISSYEKLKQWIGGWLTISDGTLIKRQNTGKTPPDWAVLYDSSTKEVMTLREFIQEGNKRIEKACLTDPEFKAQIRPILLAEFDRRNWIASPQQNGLFVIGADLFSMGQKLFTVNMNMRKVMNQVDKEFEERQKNGFISAREVYNMSRNYIPSNERKNDYDSPKSEVPTQSVQNVTPPPPPPPSVKETETIVLPKEISDEFEIPVD